MIVPPTEVMTLAPGKQGVDESDPWALASLEFERRDSWLISYIDILTLLLTLMAMLLALTPNEGVSETEPTVEASRPGKSPAVELVEADGTRLALSYSVAEPWPDISPPPEQRGLFLRMSLVARPSAVEKTDEQALIVTNETATEGLPEGAQTRETASKPYVAPVDRLMKTLATTGLSERLQAKKVAQSVHLQVHDNILFAAGSAELKSEGQGLLDDLSEAFSAHDCTISVEGHTDDRPIANNRFPSNWELSAGRATVVARYLIERGYDPARLRAIGYADTQPLAANDTPVGRAHNRRVSIVVRFPENGQAESDRGNTSIF
jgi:chemotaxis protein MotB